MRFVVDENIPLRTVQELRRDGHVVVDIRETEARGRGDDVLWSLTRHEKAILVTTDKGFAARWNEPHHGILIVRLRQPNRVKIHERVMLACGAVAEADWPGLLLVMRDRVQSSRRARSE